MHALRGHSACCKAVVKHQAISHTEREKERAHARARERDKESLRACVTAGLPYCFTAVILLYLCFTTGGVDT